MVDPKLLAEYKDQWVALTSDRSKIVEFAEDLKVLAKKIKKLKEKDVIITYVLPDSYYSPICCR